MLVYHVWSLDRGPSGGGGVTGQGPIWGEGWSLDRGLFGGGWSLDRGPSGGRGGDLLLRMLIFINFNSFLTDMKKIYHTQKTTKIYQH